MINKYEAVGIGASVVIMALALFLLRMDISQNPELSDALNTEQSALVVTTQDSSEESLREALVQSVDPSGVLQNLVVSDVVIGSGREVAAGDTVTVHYIGTLQNGQEFDNSHKKGQPLTFTVGRGQVIEGWERGIVGMKVGGERMLVVPAEFGYGRQAVGPIPGNSTLVFAIELLSIQ